MTSSRPPFRALSRQARCAFALVAALLVSGCPICRPAPADMVLAPSELRGALAETLRPLTEGVSQADLDGIERAMENAASGSRRPFGYKLERVVFVDPADQSVITGPLGIHVTFARDDLLHVWFSRYDDTDESWRLITRLGELVPERYRPAAE